MRKSRYTDEKVIAILAAQGRGMATVDLCQRHRVRSATFYKSKAKYGGMDVSEARKLKTLETENARLKKLLADSMPENSIAKWTFRDAGRLLAEIYQLKIVSTGNNANTFSQIAKSENYNSTIDLSLISIVHGPFRAGMSIPFPSTFAPV